MAPGDFDPSIHQQLGRLVEGMEGLKDSIRRMEDQARRSEDKAAESRAVVHRRLDEMVDRVGDVEQTVAVVKADVSEMKPTVEGLDDVVSTVTKDVKAMKPVTDDIQRWKLMGVGGLTVVGFGAMAMGVTFADAVKNLFSLILRR
jgi:archaellum component FlaC